MKNEEHKYRRDVHEWQSLACSWRRGLAGRFLGLEIGILKQGEHIRPLLLPVGQAPANELLECGMYVGLTYFST